MIYTDARHPTTAETILQPAALRPANIILRPANMVLRTQHIRKQKFQSKTSHSLKRQPNTQNSEVNLILYRNDSGNLYI